MVHAEISIYPVGTDTTSISFYIAKAVEVIKEFNDIRYEITPMGTILESDDIKKIFAASSAAIEAVHRLGVKRVEALLKIDSRTDKTQSMRQKVQSVDKHLSKSS